MAILPGNTLGMLGGGQLGRMFVTAARTLGYDVIVLDPDRNSPAGGLASEHLAKDYDDTDALHYLASRCAAVTTEFENVPAMTLAYLAKSVAVHPSAKALHIAQHRLLEKDYFHSLGLSTADFLAIENDKDIDAARVFGFPAILKTAMLGYDGKGQVECENFADLIPAFNRLGKKHCVLERRIDLACEVSLVLCRSQQGLVECYPVAENIHANGILDVTLAPALIDDALARDAILAANKIADGLDFVGVLAIEFFISTDNQLLVNEMAPRPHNSGHFTLDACDTSQFEQQVRMVCGLPAGSCRQHTPTAMWNLLGDIWAADDGPPWDRVLDLEMAKLHLYAKTEARPGRKMGHVNCLGRTPSAAQTLLSEVRDRLRR